METQQMAMPAEMATQGPSPEEMAIYEQMRQQISPQEFSNEMLAGASQVDPQAVAEFTQELQSLDVSPEELDALNDLVDQILANPEQYDQLRQQFLAQGMPDDILPEQFDPYFFAALNMAVDQMIAAPTGVQAFAKGGIAELKPIAKAIASYGRNGDTMLAHITPAEARMLRRRGGSGTINPATGLPEFFLKKAFKSIGKAVKKFASSTVGRLVTTVALGFFLGPAAASFLGASSVAGVAAVSGFVGSAGSTLLAGGNLKDALKAGAIGGLTAGAGAGIMGGADAFASGSASTAGLTPGQAFQGQVDKFTGAFTPGASVQAPVPEAGAPAASLGPNQMPVPDAAPYSELKMTGTPVKPFPEFFGDQASLPPTGSSAYDLNMQAQNTAARVGASSPAPGSGYPQALADTPARMPGGTGAASAYKPTTIGESFSKMGEGLGMGNEPASFKTFKEGAGELFSPTGPSPEQIDARAVELMGKNSKLPFDTAVKRATAELSPGILRTYGPAAVAGTGIMALSGGFDTKPVEGGDITKSLMKTADERIREKGTQRQMYMQGLPGVVYDEFGAPVFGKSTRLPTYDVPDYDYGGFNMSGAAAGGQGGMGLPPVYIPPPGTIGSRRVEQPYNTSDMYSNLMPQRYSQGGAATVGGTKGTFDYNAYLAANKDVMDEIQGGGSSFGTPTDLASAAFNHYTRYGKKEGRAFPVLGNTDPTTMTPAQAQIVAERQAAQEAMVAQQRAGRDIANQRRAMRRAGGSGQMYANINAGLSALAPENFPGAPVQLAADREAAMRTNFTGLTSDIDYARVMQDQGYRPEEVAALTGRSFGDINRRFRTAVRQDAAAPMLQGQRDAMAEQTRILQGARGINAPVQPPVTQPPVTQPPVTQPPVTQPPVDEGGPITTMPVTPPPGSSIDTGIKYSNQDIQSYLAANPGMTDAQIRGAMDQFGVGVDQMAAATGLPLDQVQDRYNTASKYSNQDIQNYLAANPNMSDKAIYDAMNQFGISTTQMADATGTPRDLVTARYNYVSSSPAAPEKDQFGRTVLPGSFEGETNPFRAADLAGVQRGGYSNQDIQNYLAANQGMTDAEIRQKMDQFGVGTAQMASATGLPIDQIQQRYNATLPPKLLNMGGIAALAQGGYPRRTGQISGPGTEKSDSIPAMLSDGEFVMTAKAVRGAGKGSRRAGAKQMYKLMHQLEKNSERG
jgi:uncharacterized protein YneF (UPF0154 family)